jgi:hypothetical protein
MSAWTQVASSMFACFMVAWFAYERGFRAGMRVHDTPDRQTGRSDSNG